MEGPAPLDAQPATQLPYHEALLAREYELWHRQAAMYERLLEQAELEQQRFARERAVWQTTEAALRQEAAELRAQLMYIMTQLDTSVRSASTQQPQAPTGSSRVSRQQAAIPAREPAGALPGSSGAASSVGSNEGAGLSPAEQVKAVVDAMRASSTQPTPPPPTTPQPSSPAAPAVSSVDPSTAWRSDSNEVPSYAAELAAAVAAVDNSDVLTGTSMFQLQDRRAAVMKRAREERLSNEAQSPAAGPSPPQQQQPVAPQQAPAPQSAAQAPQPAAQAAARAQPEPQAEAAGEAPRGPPPPLTLGADDVYWVNQLHTALVDLGYYPGDEDIDEFYFGEGTQSAVMTMQCCEGLAETGIADAATWAKLLGPDLAPKGSRDLTADMMLNVPGLSKLGGGSGAGEAGDTRSSRSSSGSGEQGQLGGTKPAYADLFGAVLGEPASASGNGSAAAQQPSEVAKVSTQAASPKQKPLTEWPVLHEGDGGHEVHALQISLQRAGYYCGEDDERWWSFGDGTVNAVKTFQACSGYPESGVCDAATWRLLLGENASPADLLDMRSGDSADEDLGAQSTDRVWLMGEQRWEDRSRLRRK